MPNIKSKIEAEIPIEDEIMTFKYIIIDDEQDWIERAINTIYDFNTNDEIQQRFISIYKKRIKLEILGTYTDTNMQANAMITKADLVFLDLRFGDFEAGAGYIQNSNVQVQKKFIVLSQYTEAIKRDQEQYKKVICWEQKPLKVDNLVNIIEDFYIDYKNIRSVFKDEYVEISSSGTKIYYEEIDYVKTNKNDTNTIYLLNDTKMDFGKNNLSVSKFHNKGQLMRINNSCAINIGHHVDNEYTWQPAIDKKVGDYAKHTKKLKLDIDNFKLSDNFIETRIKMISRPIL